jgi:solute carrier family 36 (proton-coupled amino acid transporter)
VKIIISIGVLLGYALQFFIAIEIMWPGVMKKYGPYKHPYASQLVFRTLMVFVTCEFKDDQNVDDV